LRDDISVVVASTSKKRLVQKKIETGVYTHVKSFTVTVRKETSNTIYRSR